MAATARSIEELFPLIEYCRAGNLREVSEWIAQGKPLDLPEGKRTRRASPLQIAVEKGFLTLAEMLLDGGADPCANGGNALWDAVNHRRSDLAELFLNRGVPLDTVSFSSVCYSGDPALVKLFLERGADPIKENPFYDGFLHCLQPMLGIYKTQLEKFPALQTQADMALCHYAKEGNLRGVSLLMWAGARPDALIPDEESSKDFGGSFAMLEAYQAGHVSILKRMKVENFPEQLPVLFNAYTVGESNAALEYLLTLRPSLSALPDGGTEMINHAFWSLGWAADLRPAFGARSLSKIDACIDRIEFLVKHGAKWKPEPDSHRNSRRHIRHLEPERILRLFGILLEHKAAEVELMETLVATPTMRKHLGDYVRKIAHLFHPPPPKPIKAEEAVPSEPPKEPPVKATLPEMTARAEAYLLDLVKESAESPFWNRSSRTYLDNQKVRRVLGMAKDDERSRLDIFNNAAARVNRKARHFEVSVDGKDYRGSVSTILVSLAGDDHNWGNVFDELLPDRRDENPRRISKLARELLFWLRKRGSPGLWFDEQAIQEGVGRTVEHGTGIACMQELEKKLGPVFQFETRKTGHETEARTEHRAWLDTDLAVDSLSADIPAPVSLNPVFSGSLGSLSKREVDPWCETILDHILAVRPAGTVPVYFLWITSDKELRRLFPSRDRDTRYWDTLVVDLLSALPLPDSFRVEYNFENPLHWFARMVPDVDWSASLQVLEGIRSQPSLQQQYGLSDDAARLLKWIEELPKEKFLGEWTPTVEDRIEKKIGIECPWEDGNFPAYIQLLLDEINGQTPYELAVQPWKSYSSWQTRIRVRKKQSEEAKLIQTIQLLGLQRGKLLSEDKVRDFLAQLLE